MKLSAYDKARQALAAKGIETKQSMTKAQVRKACEAHGMKRLAKALAA